MFTGPVDPLTHTPRDVAASMFPFGADDPPTIRVSQCCPPPVVDSAVKTPPPSAERKLSISVFGELKRGESGPIGAPLRVGDRILGFELIDELGQGAFARVFLARQEALANRQVALKVTLRPTKEAERLARLQHTHIVPVYSIHDAAPVQIICMPYLGRRTIADLVRAFRTDHASRGFTYRKTSGTRPARSTATADDRSGSRTTPPSSIRHSPLALVAGETPPELIGDPLAVLRVVGQLAAGLAHAHDRGILHLDLKPANVLLADTGEPMLLDFNLAFDVTRPERELIGGTVPYMSVEQLLDLRTRGKGDVDARSDLYSLGVMAFEMLTGTVPFPASYLADIDALIAARRAGPPSLRALNPLVSPALESIVHKLLAANPGDRYQTAEQLCSDVERHLNDLPLQHAREKSWWERIGKWRRRNPRVPGRLAAAVLFGLTLCFGGVAYVRAESNAKAEAHVRVAETRSGLDRLRLDLVLPGDAVARRRGIDKAAAVLAGYGLSEDSNWEKSESLRRLSEQDRISFVADMGELLLLLAQARWQEAEGRPEAERRELARVALKMNEAARGCFPPEGVPHMLERQAVFFKRALGEEVEVPAHDAARVPTAREQFLDAAAHVSSGRYDTAVAALERTIEDQPGHAAAQFCLAYCREREGLYQRSLERYDAARVLLPNDPRPFYQRGGVCGLVNDREQAEREYTRAIAIDPGFALAYRNRALVRLRLAKLAEAEDDLNRALDCDAPALQVHLLRADIRDKRQNAAGAAADRARAAGLTPKVEGDFLVRGLTRMTSDPSAAIDDFKSAARINPRSLAALQNQAHLQDSHFHDTRVALELMDRAVELYPEFAPARIGRAVLLARLDRREEALQELETALKNSLSEDPGLSYRAACVYALTASKVVDESLRERDRKLAFDWLRTAIRKGYRDAGRFEQDSDLASLRSNPEFKDIVKASASLR